MTEHAPRLAILDCSSKKAWHCPSAEFPPLCQVKQCLPHVGIRIGLIAGVQFLVAAHTGFTTAAGLGQAGETNAGAFSLVKYALEVSLIFPNRHGRLEQPQSFVDCP